MCMSSSVPGPPAPTPPPPTAMVGPAQLQINRSPASMNSGVRALVIDRNVTPAVPVPKAA